MVVWDMFRFNKMKGETVFSQLSEAHSEAQRVTREWIKFIARVLRHCASQESPSERTVMMVNKENFMGAVSLVLSHSQELRDI